MRKRKGNKTRIHRETDRHNNRQRERREGRGRGNDWQRILKISFFLLNILSKKELELFQSG